jgi:RNA polymerase sigma factor (TIGR02999 family)
MNTPLPTPEITNLLGLWRQGDRVAEDELMRTVYPVLRDIAQARLRSASDDLTLCATELVHEAYARLARAENVEYNDRGHFYAVAARAIRNFLIDHLRARGSEKRGGDLPFVPLELAENVEDPERIDLRVDWLAVHEALVRLEAVDAECARIVELKFFSGLSTDEIAQACNVSRATVVRSWRFAKAWLADQLRKES